MKNETPIVGIPFWSSSSQFFVRKLSPTVTRVWLFNCARHMYSSTCTVDVDMLTPSALAAKSSVHRRSIKHAPHRHMYYKHTAAGLTAYLLLEKTVFREATSVKQIASSSQPLGGKLVIAFLQRATLTTSALQSTFEIRIILLQTKLVSLKTTPVR